MKRKNKSMLKMILTDWKHWLGWGITAGAIILMFTIFGSSSMILNVLLLLGTVVAVDVIKHLTKLQ